MLRAIVTLVVLGTLGLLAIRCGAGERPAADRARSPAGEPDEALLGRARELARHLPLVDTHIDLPYRLTERAADVSRRTAEGDFDYPRARQGGLDLAFMSIYVPASYQESGGAKTFADELIDMVHGLAAAHPEAFTVVVDPQGARAVAGTQRVGLALGMENGAPLEGRLDNLAYFHDRGIRYVTLTHSRANAISDSSFDEERPWGGLSPFGREVVAEMNRLGMMIDVSHVSDDAFWQVLELSRAPVIASHSSLRHFTPGWERNMSDEMVRALGEEGGVVQINFGSSFVDDRFRRARHAGRDEVKRLALERGLVEASDEWVAFEREWWAEHPLERPTVAAVADHIDRAVALAGIAHVGLGSDFDGVGDTLPDGLRDVSAYPNLLAELLRRGYTEQELAAICGENLLRVWSEVERLAGEADAGRASPG